MYCPTCGRIRCHVYFSIEDRAYRCPDAHIFSLSSDALGVSINPNPTGKKRAYRYDCEPEPDVGVISKKSASSGDMNTRYLYAGGKRFYDEWREAVFKRDGYKCQKCGSSEKLQVHHVKPFLKHPHLVIVIDNGMTLCEDCHRDVDDIHRKMVTTSS